ncbi:1,2-phenylacetyl-CoA epoxidase subunit PaaD [Janthinobacterium sp. UMAB-56]|uniref:1,2-phenylacetyl-CoA epoxidase subunit PaaD n=1 Tax=Janthinobacterium sp. UMAB-56 TaxID=1365361 RepID=UPI001C57077E|nr:1,2-phenylacetyl-CoA epoxidase subunit PaaD [Janthinobacterium sp. UMAB-56]
MSTPAAALDAAQVWAWLGDVPDPEIPVISVVDLGIVRAVDVVSNDECIVTITPTYSGCPAMQVIADAVTDALRSRGVQKVTLVNQLAPAWTTDWMSEAGKVKLKGYGIAPPQQQVIDISGLKGGVKRQPMPKLDVICPNCGSTQTQLTSQFGSTPCKALYKCLACREPFDYFKCH